MVSAERSTLSVEEFDRLVRLPDNQDRLFELMDGAMIEKMPTNAYCSAIAIRLAILLGQYVLQNNLGEVTGADGGYMIGKNRMVPDVAYMSKTRQAAIPTHGDYNPLPPDLAVEVKSPTDSLRELRQKADKMLAGGVTLVWLVIPEGPFVEVYQVDQDILIVPLDGTLTGDPVLPGFSLTVRDIFPPNPAV